MDRRDFIHCASIASISLAVPARGQQRSVKDLGVQLEAIRKEHGFPGIAGAAVRGGALVAEGVAGVRRVGQDDKITPDDRFALASCTKRMTAAMIARVIDSGKLSFDTTLAEALPEMPMRGDYRNVTVTQLLTFTGGFQPYMQVPNKFQLKGSPAEEREQFIEHLLQEEPVVKPGTERVYSNASYALVAFVAEQRTGKSWETLMQSEVFKPLGMTTAGFGRPRSKDRPNEPTMHINDGDGYKPEDDERANAMRPVAPAGDVHCSIRDFAKFASYELNAAQGNDALLGPATAQRWQELSRRPGPAGGEGKGGKTKKGKRENEEPKSAKPVSGERPPGQQVEAGGNTKSDGWSFSGGSPAVCTGCILWPSINLATVVAINGGFARDAVQAAFEAIKEREAEFVK